MAGSVTLSFLIGVLLSHLCELWVGALCRGGSPGFKT
jgi:hypothetical protein